MEIGLDELNPIGSSTPLSSSKRPQDTDTALFESLQKRVGESGTILKNLSKAQQQPITPRTAFANYVKDSLLTMSKAKYKKARSTINKLLSDLMDEDSDDDMMMTGGMEAPATPSTQKASYSQLRHPLRPSSTLSVGSSASSTSEKYQPQPHMWRNVPPASSVWGSQSMEYMEQYHQQPFQHSHQQIPPLLQQKIVPRPQQPRQQTQQQQQPTPTPVYAVLASAAQVLSDQPSPTQPSPGTASEHSIPNMSTLSNLSGLSAIMGSPPNDGKLDTP